MTTLLALLAFIAITTVLGFLLAWLSSSGTALRLRVPGLFRTGVHGSPAKADSERRTGHGGEPAVTDTSLEGQPIDQLIEAVNARLPQTQCAQCGHPGCRPYATAIILEDAPINQCPPGGDALIRELAEFLGKEPIALDAARGISKPPQVAVIDEPACIGCTLCILACPVDAIVGASRLMHTVISDQCTGCELCLPPCPVDCIELVPAKTPLAQWRWPKPA